MIFVSINYRNNYIVWKYPGFRWPAQSFLYIHIQQSGVCPPGFHLSAVFHFCPVLPVVAFGFRFELLITVEYNRSSGEKKYTNFLGMTVPVPENQSSSFHMHIGFETFVI
jgi:hypothetical protein